MRLGNVICVTGEYNGEQTAMCIQMATIKWTFLSTYKNNIEQKEKNKENIFGTRSPLVFHDQQHRWTPGIHMDNKLA